MVKYDRHALEWQRCLTDPERERIGATWLKNDTLDRWRHDRMLSPVEPFVTDGNWLTVGDGRYGSDAIWLKARGAQVHASDISSTLLEIAAERGLIDQFSEQNAEALDFEDGAFDYVLCKESAHHFPRPWIAITEMMRVARKGVVLIEPHDQTMRWTAAYALRRLMGHPDHSFEPVGNYVYSFTRREFEKFQLGMHRRYCAFQGINDHADPRAAFTDCSDLTSVVMRTRFTIMAKNLLCFLGFTTPHLILAFMFKGRPENELERKAVSRGWSFVELPENPFT